MSAKELLERSVGRLPDYLRELEGDHAIFEDMQRDLQAVQSWRGPNALTIASWEKKGEGEDQDQSAPPVDQLVLGNIARITGFVADEIRGKFPQLVVYLEREKRKKLIDRRIGDDIEHKGEVNMQYALRTKEGGHIWVNDNSVVFHYGDIRLAIGSLTKMTDEDIAKNDQIAELHDKLKKRENEVEKAKRYTKDLLTDFWVRRFYEEVLEDRVSEALEKNGNFGLLIADLDNLKEANSKFGHHGGDHYIKGASEVIKRVVRDYDVVARVGEEDEEVSDDIGRIGGDEFAIILPFTDRESCVRIAKRIQEEMQKELEKGEGSLFYYNGEMLNAGMTIGVGDFGECDKKTAEAVYKKVDDRLMKGKEIERGVVYFED